MANRISKLKSWRPLNPNVEQSPASPNSRQSSTEIAPSHPLEDQPILSSPPPALITELEQKTYTSTNTDDNHRYILAHPTPMLTQILINGNHPIESATNIPFSSVLIPLFFNNTIESISQSIDEVIEGNGFVIWDMFPILKAEKVEGTEEAAENTVGNGKGKVENIEEGAKGENVKSKKEEAEARGWTRGEMIWSVRWIGSGTGSGCGFCRGNADNSRGSGQGIGGASEMETKACIEKDMYMRIRTDRDLEMALCLMRTRGWKDVLTVDLEMKAE